MGGGRGVMKGRRVSGCGGGVISGGRGYDGRAGEVGCKS